MIRLLTAAAILSTVACAALNNGRAFPDTGFPIDKTHLETAAFTPGHLYVANRYHDIAIYPFSSKNPTRTISPFVSVCGNAIALDIAGNLYASRCTGFEQGKSFISVYAAGSSSLLRSITQGLLNPTALAFDREGNLYVANCHITKTLGGWISVYPPGGTEPQQTITEGLDCPRALLFDAAGNLYAANGFGGITVYAPGKKALLRTITSGISNPRAMVFDSQGDLYVANNHRRSGGSITVYAPGRASILRTITEGVHFPQSLAIDSSGDLYVGNLWGGVNVYAPGTSNVARSLHLPQRVRGLVFDPTGYLYVAWFHISTEEKSGAVAVYPPGGAAAFLTIAARQGVYQPAALAIGP